MELTDITYENKPVENMGSSKKLNNTGCLKCGTKMKRSLISHDLGKMYTIIFCPQHPLVVWEDVFKKRDIDTSQDYTNRDKRFDKHY